MWNIQKENLFIFIEYIVFNTIYSIIKGKKKNKLIKYRNVS